MSERRFAIKRDLTLLKQRCNAQIIIVYEGGMFKCDEHLVCYSSIIKDNDVILDVNSTPVKITNAKDFQNKVIAQHRMVMNEYAEEYKKIVQ